MVPMRRRPWIALALLAATGCAASRRQPIQQGPREGVYERGIASVYARSLAGRPTASGERYDPSIKTCAHRRLPLGSTIEVFVVKTGVTAVCRVNDRGPYVHDRVVDLSTAMADALGLEGQGLARVEIRVLDATSSDRGR
jgi:rare lipoprotein A